jgi:hypothetical protein
MDHMGLLDFERDDPFRMQEYRRVILSCVEECNLLFSAVPRIAESLRLDRVRRFVTLVYMWQEREVELAQYGEDILVERYEAYDEGQSLS